MSVRFQTNGRILRMNAWNWGVLHHVVAAFRVLPEDLWEPARFAHVRLEANEVAALLRCLERDVLPCLREGERMLFDGSVTTEPDDGTFYREEAEMLRNYSLHHDVLAELIAFLRSTSDGVEIG